MDLKSITTILFDIFRSNIIEIGVFQGFFHRDSSGWVEVDHLQEKVKAKLVKVLEVSIRVDGLEFGEGRFEVRQVIYINVFKYGYSSIEQEWVFRGTGRS